MADLLNGAFTKIPLDSFKNDDEWRESRKSYIGGSDAGKILGMSSYGSALTVYCDKKGMTSFDGNKATRRGKILEPVVRDYTREELHVGIAESPYMYVSNEYPFMLANIDGIFVTDEPVLIGKTEVLGMGGHEIKTSMMATGFSEDEVPDEYYCQVQHYMAVLNLAWFILSVYMLMKDEVKHYYVPRNDDFIKNVLIPGEKDFWENYFMKNIMPAPDGIDSEEDLVTGMFSPGDGVLVLTSAEEELCRDYEKNSAIMKEAEACKKAAGVALKLSINNRGHGNVGLGKVSAQAGEFSISWSRFITKRVDGDKLKIDGLYEKYSKESESGQFRITNKGA